ncbi:hypothetical protein [Streptomyces atratus]|uniref:hypothetical protein n=1 Tax=Streptomyces atratus TaxID=1893 RepID=UPI0022564976|nr:hypothetical protein [Streptomyces atratus]MCX5345968.1 hypothetical protein [Streptomyces atratus]
MNTRMLVSRAAVTVATLGVVTAGSALQTAQAAAPATPAVFSAVGSAGELFPELNGVRIKAVGSDDVYLVLDGKRHLIPSSVTYGALFRSTDGIRLLLTADNIADGGPLTAYAYLARTADDATVYLVSNGLKREITPAAVDKFGFDWQKVRTTYDWVLADLPSAAPLV